MMIFLNKLVILIIFRLNIDVFLKICGRYYHS